MKHFHRYSPIRFRKNIFKVGFINVQTTANDRFLRFTSESMHQLL